MSELSYNSLIVNKVFAENIETNDGVKYLDENESIGKYGFSEMVLSYDWSPDYSNALQHFGVSGYTAQTSGWLSVDRAEKDVTSIFINDNITNTFYNDGSYQVFLTRGDSVTASSKIDITFAPSVSESAELPVPLTNYDIWSEVPFVDNDGYLTLKNLFIPNASFWNLKIYKPNNLTITKVENNKAYNGEEFVCNIQSEKIKNGSRLFLNCPELVTFNSDLSLLDNGNLMFFNTRLDSLSVERILTSIPTYTSGVHNLTMTIRESAVEKFSEIVGLDITDKINKINYKGWEITLLTTDDREIPTDYDIWKEVVIISNNMKVTIDNLYIPDASGWNSEIYQKNNLIITSVENDKAYNDNNFVCNIQSGNIENGSDLFKNAYELTSFSNSLNQLKNGSRLFLNSGLTDFSVELSSLDSAKNMFIGCPLSVTSIETILNSLPTYTSGNHEIGLTLKSETEASKFTEITGTTINQGQIYTVSYKGWNIKTYLSKDDREIQTNYDIWENVIGYDSKTDDVGFIDLYLPDASAWKSEVYDKARLQITSVENNKAYNGDNFVCNIKTDKIVNGDGLFNEVSSLVTFTSPLSSLLSGDNMFNGCILDVASVENILGSIPTYSSGQHVLTMKIAGDSVEKFKEITGCGEIGREMVSVSYKGWTINVNVDARLSTDFDIWEGTPYIPDASNWRTDVYDEHGLIITDISDNKIYNGDEFVCNIQCESIENIETIESVMDIFVGKAFSNTNLTNVSGNFSSLGMMLNTFANTNISNFYGNLSSVYTGLFPFSGCYKLSSFDSDLSSLVIGGNDKTSMEFFEVFMKIKGFFSNTKLSSFDKNLNSLICGGAMFTNCNKLSSFRSDISSLGNYIKIFEVPDMEGVEPPAPYPPQTQEDINAWNEWNNLNYTSAFMFMGCNLDAESVEHILYSLPSYNDGLVRGLGMTINPEAATRFGEITGTTPTTNYTIAATTLNGMGVEMVEYKGWTILVNLYNNVSLVPDYDIPEGTEIISEWPLSGEFTNSNSSLYLIDNKIVGMGEDSVLCLANINLDSVWYIADYGIFGGVQNFGLDFPSLEIGTALFVASKFSSFNSYLGNLKLDMLSFYNCGNLSAFLSSLKSLSYSFQTFCGCSSLTVFLSDLRSLCIADGMFQGCSSLSSFTLKLTSLGNYEKGYSDYINTAIKIPDETGTPPTLEEFITQFPGAQNMFSGCQLDAASVENILTSIPEWNDDYYRELGMTIQSGEAATKFGEITGIIPASTEIIEVPFKGWNIKVNLFSV